MNFLALDSGLERTGYAVIENQLGVAKLVSFGCIETKRGDDISKRIFDLGKHLSRIIDTYSPTLIVMEQIFFNINKKTVISVAQAQGAVMFIGAQRRLPIEFISPLSIKLSVTGYGRSDKKSVQKMVGILMKMDKLPTPDDVVDAIACGIAYCATSKIKSYS